MKRAMTPSPQSPPRSSLGSMLSFARWQSRYPLDPKMLALLWAAKPLAAAFACREDRFFTPGAHAVHRLLDTLHEGFAGWSC